MKSDYLRIKCKTIDTGKLAIALMHLRSCGLTIFDFEGKVRTNGYKSL